MVLGGENFDAATRRFLRGAQPRISHPFPLKVVRGPGRPRDFDGSPQPSPGAKSINAGGRK